MLPPKALISLVHSVRDSLPCEYEETRNLACSGICFFQVAGKNIEWLNADKDQRLNLALDL